MTKLSCIAIAIRIEITIKSAHVAASLTKATLTSRIARQHTEIDTDFDGDFDGDFDFDFDVDTRENIST